MKKAFIFKKPGKDEMALVGDIQQSEIASYQRSGWLFDREAQRNKNDIPIVTKEQYLRYAEQ